MTNPVVVAIRDAQARMARGEIASVLIDTDAIEPMDDDDKGALRYFFDRED